MKRFSFRLFGYVCRSHGHARAANTFCRPPRVDFLDGRSAPEISPMSKHGRGLTPPSFPFIYDAAARRTKKPKREMVKAMMLSANYDDRALSFVSEMTLTNAERPRLPCECRWAASPPPRPSRHFGVEAAAVRNISACAMLKARACAFGRRYRQAARAAMTWCCAPR